MRDVIAFMASMARNRATRAVTRGQEAEAVDDLDAAAKKLAAPDRTIAQASRPAATSTSLGIPARYAGRCLQPPPITATMMCEVSGLF